MHAQPPPVRAQTIKQAKAAYKSRGAPTINEREKRQLDRACELAQRAERARESEKKRVEAAKKRVEKVEKDRKEKAERLRTELGTQRRYDRFGYKSSQMHLGAFMRTPVTAARQASGMRNMVETEEDSFGDGDLDDETLLDAMEDVTPAPRELPRSMQSVALKKPESRVIEQPGPQPAATGTHTIALDYSSLFDEFESSTQLARELTIDNEDRPEQQVLSKVSSFSSDGFDLTVEDLEALEASAAAGQVDQDRKLMPPPPPPPPMKLGVKSLPLPQSRATGHGLSMLDLEELADQDICLTQADAD